MEENYRHKSEEGLGKMIDSNDFYVAHQGEGHFDEIQRLSLAYLNRHPAAIEGEPGVGKNQAIKVLSKALGRPTYRVRCTEEMTARDIIGGEKLEAEKSETGDLATKTVYAPGKLYRGMRDGALVVLDEVNQLNPTVQKAMNSALEDTRTVGYLEGGEDVSAHDGFGLFLTYNPDTGIATDDLEVAVKDRCKLFYFEDLPAELKLRIGLLRTGRFDLSDFLRDGLSMRGLHLNGSLGFVDFREGSWFGYGKDEQVGNEGRIEPYLFYNKGNVRPLDFEDERKQEYCQVGRAIVNTLDQVKDLRKNGTRKAREDLGLHLDEVSRVNVTIPSPRLTIKLMEDYMRLRDMGYSSGQALGDVSQTITDSSVPAGERKLQIGENLDVAGLVKQISASNGIVDNSILTELRSRATQEARDNLVKDLMERGYLEPVARRLADEYSK